MSALTAPPTYTALAALAAGDAVATAVPVPYIARTLDRLGVPAEIRPVLPVVKAAAALGLLSVFRFPGLARLTTALLTLYFAVAVVLHIRVRDTLADTVPAAAFLAVFAAMTATGPDAG